MSQKKNIFEPWRKYYREEDTPRTDQGNVKNRKANLLTKYNREENKPRTDFCYGINRRTVYNWLQ